MPPIDNVQNDLKRSAKISLTAMAVLFILSVIFYKERVLFADGASILFSIAEKKKMVIQVNRYGSFITQLFPYIGQQLGLPLKRLLLLYSISFNLFFLAAQAALVYWFKQYRLAILMGLFYFLFVSQSFLWTNEVFQGVAWMFLFFGATLHMGGKETPLYVLIAPFTALLFLAIFTHFVIIIPTVFLWLYLVLEQKNWPFGRKDTIILSVLIVAVIIAKFMVSIFFAEKNYDSNAMEDTMHLTLRHLAGVFTKPVIRMFLSRCITNYWAGVALFIAGIFSLVKNNQKGLAAFALLTGIGYVGIMGLTFGKFDAGFHLFHIESEWACISIIAATPFVFSILPGNKPRSMAWLLVGIFLIRLVYIGAYIPAFTARNQMKEEILAQMRKKGISKLAIYQNKTIEDVMILDWGLTFESMIMSQIAGEKPQRTFLFVNKDNKDKISQLPAIRGITNDWETIPPHTLNHQYFEADSTVGYQISTYEALMK